jgi:hypothetical protein
VNKSVSSSVSRTTYIRKIQKHFQNRVLKPTTFQKVEKHVAPAKHSIFRTSKPCYNFETNLHRVDSSAQHELSRHFRSPDSVSRLGELESAVLGLLHSAIRT